MNQLRESSQQDRRVYVGNLSYDVKWHHLKDFMRQGEGIVTSFSPSWIVPAGPAVWADNWVPLCGFDCSAGDVLFADVLLLPNGMSKVGF